jgi:hypothetical protein
VRGHWIHSWILWIPLSAIAGCAAPPQPDSVCLNKELKIATVLWRAEADEVSQDALIVVVHGVTYNGEWHVAPDTGPLIRTRDFAWTLRHLHPGREIVLVVCNRGEHTIDTPSVYYTPKGLTWVWPDRFIPYPRPLGNGSIRRMVHNN